jgi:hypothetical protein
MMPQLSSTERLLIAAQEITHALQHPHPEVPFYIIGDHTITPLATLADTFKNKFQKSPVNAAERNAQQPKFHQC